MYYAAAYRELAADPDATVLCVFPTKALAQDQLASCPLQDALRPVAALLAGALQSALEILAHRGAL